MMAVRNLSSLIRDKAFVNGQWIPAESGQTFEVKNPANGSVITSVPNMNGSDTERAITTAAEAFDSFKKTTAKYRSDLLRRWFNLAEKNSDLLAELITLENGKAMAESKGEVVYGSGFLEWYAEEGKRAFGEVIPASNPARRLVTIKQPVGVVGCIVPWNFPYAMITRKVAPAIAAGCTVVLKPAEDTPLTALALAALADDAGFPPGVFNIVTCGRDNASEVGKTLCQSQTVRKISFTGSSAVGKLLLAQSADTVKKVSMELGGNAPFIVFESADLDLAVQGAMGSKFRCSGQTCICANRFYVHENVRDQFVERLEAAMKTQLKVGPGNDANCNQGPLINRRAVEKVHHLVSDADEKGAKVLMGGIPFAADDESKCNFYPPTLITNVNRQMEIASEEIFGPVAAVMTFRHEDEVVQLANMTRAGLAGYFYSRDLDQIWRVAEQLEFGMVGVNESVISCIEAPFGGIKESGLGKEGSRHGIEEYFELKYICFGNLKTTVP